MRRNRRPKVEGLMVVEDIYDIFYLTGQKVSKGTLLIYPEEAFFLVDHRYLEACQANQEMTTLLHSEENVQKVLQSYAFDTFFLAGNKLSYDAYRRWEGLCTGKEVRNIDLLRTVRLIKDAEEIAKLRRAAMLNREAMDKIERELSEGVLEEEIAWEFEKYTRERGASGMAFTPQIIFGAKTSQPHHKSGKTALRNGDAVTLDLGVVVDSYVSDRTRSFLFRGQNSAYEALFALVQEAHQRALKKVQIGVPLYAIAELVAQFFQEQGVEKLVKHHLGHSLGLEVHEYPTLAPSLPKELLCEEGMLFTLEPGLYVEGLFGARHEDTVLVTKRGAEIL